MSVSFLTFVTSLILSISSGFCTVVGIGNIFTSAPITTMVIAGSIEIARVVLIYDLHHYWKQMSLFNKVPGIGMLLIAMSLSALGVFGFFANAYSARTKEIIPLELEVQQLKSELPVIDIQIDNNNKQLNSLQKSLSSKHMDKVMDKYLERDYVSKALNVQKDVQKNIQKLIDENKVLSSKKVEIQKNITTLQITMEKKAPSVAHLKYLAQLLHTTNDNAIIIFIVMIMLVFDTLAMYLMVTSDWISSLKGTPGRKKTQFPWIKKINTVKQTKKSKKDIDNMILNVVKSLSEVESTKVVRYLENELGKTNELVKKLKKNLKN